MKVTVIPSDKVILRKGNHGFFYEDDIEFCANVDGIEKEYPFADPDDEYKKIYVCAVVEDEAMQLLVKHITGGYYSFSVEDVLHAGESVTETLFRALKQHGFNPDDICALSKGGYYVDQRSISILYTVTVPGRRNGDGWMAVNDVFELGAHNKLADWSTAALYNLV